LKKKKKREKKKKEKQKRRNRRDCGNGRRACFVRVFCLVCP